jgi:hypothetical protein
MNFQISDQVDNFMNDEATLKGDVSFTYLSFSVLTYFILIAGFLLY